MRQYDFSTTISSDFGIFGLPFEEKDCRLILLPVPWEVTTSYGQGASNGPRIIRKASEQIDLFDLETNKAYEAGYFMREISEDILNKSQHYKKLAQELIHLKTLLSEDTVRETELINQVNASSAELNEWVYRQCKEILNSGRLLGLVGGDHSTPYGAIKAISEKYSGDFGILHIDAHADLRRAYQGFQYSHASIMYNVMTAKWAPKQLVQVGVRDFCEEEFQFIQENSVRIKTYFDQDNKNRMLKGMPWSQIVDEIIQELPSKVYISFDIDGLNPQLCPHTGTPVIGGLSTDEAFFLFSKINSSGKQIVGFDLNEVSTGPHKNAEWDGNVGARVLYKLCGWTVVTNRP